MQVRIQAVLSIEDAHALKELLLRAVLDLDSQMSEIRDSDQLWPIARKRACIVRAVKAIMDGQSIVDGN
jgi:hypothetical protein